MSRQHFYGSQTWNTVPNQFLLQTKGSVDQVLWVSSVFKTFNYVTSCKTIFWRASSRMCFSVIYLCYRSTDRKKLKGGWGDIFLRPSLADTRKLRCNIRLHAYSGPFFLAVKTQACPRLIPRSTTTLLSVSSLAPSYSSVPASSEISTTCQQYEVSSLSRRNGVHNISNMAFVSSV